MSVRACRRKDTRSNRSSRRYDRQRDKKPYNQLFQALTGHLIETASLERQNWKVIYHTYIPHSSCSWQLTALVDFQASTDECRCSAASSRCRSVENTEIGDNECQGCDDARVPPRAHCWKSNQNRDTCGSSPSWPPSLNAVSRYASRRGDAALRLLHHLHHPEPHLPGVEKHFRWTEGGSCGWCSRMRWENESYHFLLSTVCVLSYPLSRLENMKNNRIITP